MKLRLSLADHRNGAEIVSLYRWLAQDPDVRHSAALSIDSAGTPGTMGPGLDFINVVLSNSIAAITALITAIGLWRTARPQRSEVRIETTTTTVIIVAGADSRALRKLATELSTTLPVRADQDMP